MLSGCELKLEVYFCKTMFVDIADTTVTNLIYV